MKIYIVFEERGMYVTADKFLALHENFKNVKAIQEWEVKTQGKNFSTFAKGKFIIDNSNNN